LHPSLLLLVLLVLHLLHCHLPPSQTAAIPTHSLKEHLQQ
jgi:hypothetical protein